MTIANPAIAFTPDDLLRMEDAVHYELVDGQLVERRMGMESSGIAARILTIVGSFAHDRGLGRPFGADASYQCFADAPLKVRRPDVSFVRADRLPDGRVPLGHCPVAPDLAVEVISPNDLAYEIEGKVVEYLTAGVPLVWVVHPPTRTVRIHRPRSSPRGPVAELLGADEITGEDVLAGFAVKVSEFFE